MRSILIIVALISTFLVNAQSANWVAPKKSSQISNPVAPSKETIKSGKALYKAQCAVCHGNSGKGDGIGGIALNPRPANFTRQLFTQQSDGAIFWKITAGNPPMASYKVLLKEVEIWQVINYIRTLDKSK